MPTGWSKQKIIAILKERIESDLTDFPVVIHGTTLCGTTDYDLMSGTTGLTTELTGVLLAESWDSYLFTPEVSVNGVLSWVNTVGAWSISTAYAVSIANCIYNKTPGSNSIAYKALSASSGDLKLSFYVYMTGSLSPTVAPYVALCASAAVGDTRVKITCPGAGVISMTHNTGTVTLVTPSLNRWYKIEVFMASAAYTMYAVVTDMVTGTVVTSSSYYWITKSGSCSHLYFNQSACSPTTCGCYIDDVLVEKTADYSRKIAVTDVDDNPLFVERTSYDFANNRIFLTVNVPDVYKDVNTILLLWYDKTQSDNAYLATVNDATRTTLDSVYASDLKLMLYFEQNPAAIAPAIKDSSQSQSQGYMHGTMTFLQQRIGYIGKCIYLDGVDDYISFPATQELTFTTALTACILFKPSTLVGNASIISKWDSVTGNYGSWNILLNGQKIEVWVADPVTGLLTYKIRTSNDEIISTDAWYNVAVTFEADEVKVYINQELIPMEVISGEAPSILNSVAVGLYIGTHNQGESGTAKFNGYIDVVALYNTCKTSAWIQALYNSWNDSLLKVYDIRCWTGSYNQGNGSPAYIDISSAGSVVGVVAKSLLIDMQSLGSQAGVVCDAEIVIEPRGITGLVAKNLQIPFSVTGFVNNHDYDKMGYITFECYGKIGGYLNGGVTIEPVETDGLVGYKGEVELEPLEALGTFMSPDPFFANLSIAPVETYGWLGWGSQADVEIGVEALGTFQVGNVFNGTEDYTTAIEAYGLLKNVRLFRGEVVIPYVLASGSFFKNTNFTFSKDIFAVLVEGTLKTGLNFHATLQIEPIEVSGTYHAEADFVGAIDIPVIEAYGTANFQSDRFEDYILRYIR